MFTISTLALNAVSANIADRLGVAIPYPEHQQPLGVAIPYAEHQQPLGVAIPYAEHQPNLGVAIPYAERHQPLGVAIPYAEHQQPLGIAIPYAEHQPRLGMQIPYGRRLGVAIPYAERQQPLGVAIPYAEHQQGLGSSANADLNGWSAGDAKCDCDVHCGRKPMDGAPSYEEITIKVTCNCDCSGPGGTHEHAKSTTTIHLDTQNPSNDWTTSSSNVEGNDPWGWATANAAGNVDGWNNGVYNNGWSNANAAETNGWSTANANAGDVNEWYYPSYYLGADKEKDVQPAKAPKEDAQKRLGWGYFHEYKW